MSWRAVHAYRISDGGPRGDREVVLGKLLTDDHTRVFSRRARDDVARLHKNGTYSIDARAVDQWRLDRVDYIQFIDSATETSMVIPYDAWLLSEDVTSYGAGLQSYVLSYQFDHFEYVRWPDKLYTDEVVDLSRSAPQPPKPEPQQKLL